MILPLPSVPSKSQLESNLAFVYEGPDELFPNPVDGRDNLSGDPFTVDEHDAVDQLS